MYRSMDLYDLARSAMRSRRVAKARLKSCEEAAAEVLLLRAEVRG